MSEPGDQIRTVRLAFELRIGASAQRTFEMMTQQSLDWFPVTCGEDRVRRVVQEPRAGGQPARTWGDGCGHLYGRSRSTIRRCAGPPAGGSCRGRSSIPATGWREEAGAVAVSVTKVATAPMTAKEAAGIAQFGDSPATLPRSRSSRPAEASHCARWRNRVRTQLMAL
jgi:hypothetical protein